MPALLLALVGVSAAAASPPASQAQDTVPAAGPQEGSEPLAKWQCFHEVPLPKSGKSLWVDFLLPVSVFDESREDLGDLRLYDGRGRERPYALRVRQARDERQQLAARLFNRQTHPDHSIEVTLDLGERPAEHNEVEVATSGADFRRGAMLEGSDRDSDRDWGKLVEGAWLAHYRIDGQVIDIHRLRYTPSRFRYLRIRVFPDRSQPDDAPEFSSLVVFHTVREPGEYVTRDAQVGPREAVRAASGPGSAWIIDLGGRQVPCEKLSIATADVGFVRPFVMEILDGVVPRQVVTSGELRGQTADPRKPLEVSLGREVRAHRLRLVVTDHNNPPLQIEAMQYTAAVRQVIFAHAEGPPEPLQLYAGNPQAGSPHYDLAATLPAVLEPPPARTTLGEPRVNPIFQPEPKPWTERWPWLVYVVLGFASLALLAMLGGLARVAIRRHDAAQAAELAAPARAGI